MQFHKFIKHQHTCWDKFAGQPEFKAVLDAISTQERLPHRQMTSISESTGIPISTLKTWRRKRKKDPEYTPRHGRHRCLILPDHVILSLIENANIHVKNNDYFPMQMFRAVAKKKAEEAGITEFKASNRWVMKTLKDNDLSFRTPHIQRRTPPDDARIAEFTSEMDAARDQYPERLIFNADETFWRICNGKLKTLARRGADDVRVTMDFGGKEGLTVMAAISMEGNTLPVWAIVKGSTSRCEERFRNDPRLRRFLTNHRLILKHTQRGWMNEKLAIEFIEFLSGIVGERHCYLLWDVYRSHRTDAVKAKAEQLGIGLGYVPAGQTPDWQPLDRRIFGDIKKRAQAEFDKIAAERPKVDLVDALVILMTVWESLPAEKVTNAWKMFRE